MSEERQQQPDAELAPRWEYRIEAVGWTITEQLNKLGAEGWELCAIDSDDNYYLKRRIP